MKAPAPVVFSPPVIRTHLPPEALPLSREGSRQLQDVRHDERRHIIEARRLLGLD